MKHIYQKNIKVIDELMSFCYKYGATDIHIDVKYENESFFIEVESQIFNLSQEILEITNRLLSAPRCHEMESYYWGLSGDDDTDTELTLVGMMSDEAHIDYCPKTGKMQIKIVRHI
ncbi:hypothetical protein [Oceanirhabdus sp. W0125-5]|uniref:hypothetical protein n=1 Tax=Oceanirhabdus sp. W0125-5 TaxID=2999116 RepID=UPI0022F2E157|nr:hypothetical protein [Oceanirhabdus sp. W0125-5]WBW97551.1 hypothetical protein OW730_01680 [Oceanirhabdus sp. W0125-5]